MIASDDNNRAPANIRQSKGALNKNLSQEKTPTNKIPPLTRKQRRLELGESSDIETEDEGESDIVEINRNDKLIKQVVKGIIRAYISIRYYSIS